MEHKKKAKRDFYPLYKRKKNTRKNHNNSKLERHWTRVHPQLRKQNTIFKHDEYYMVEPIEVKEKKEEKKKRTLIERL